MARVLSLFLIMGAMTLAMASQKVEAAAGRFIVVMVDLSGSTKPYRADFEQYFKTILEATEEGDAIAIVRIDEKPAGGSVMELITELPEFSLFGDYEGDKAKARARKEEALAKVKKMLEKNAKETPILDTLMEAERLLATFPRCRKVLVLLSDMLEVSARYNFETTPPTTKRREAIIKELKDRRKIANLKDVVVYVAGARAKSVEVRDIVKRFWMNYFQESGAKATDERYGAELLEFESDSKRSLLRYLPSSLTPCF